MRTAWYEIILPGLILVALIVFVAAFLYVVTHLK
jgi:hypothetical protein